MKLHHVALSSLKPSPLNVRKHGGDDVSDLVASIRTQGVLQPLLVRRNCEGYEVIAGGRRLKACQVVAGESDQPFAPVPCAEIEDGDDAAAIEASLAENIARLPMDELDQYEAFAALIKTGRTVEDIAATFGVTERMVRQRLALASLMPAVLALYRRNEISAETMRALTLATKAQQKAWLKRFRDPNDFTPQGRALRQWLLGGEQIATSAALFPLTDYTGAIVTDLFGEDAYFADPDAFWTLQMTAVADKAAAYRARGWSEVVVLDRGAFFQSYDHAKVAKTDGGKVYIHLSHSGTVACHEGFLTFKELRQRDKAGNGADTTTAVTRPELSKAALNYLDLHRHSAVKAALLGRPAMALRLMVAHAIAGSPFWRVEPDPCRTDKPETAASLSSSMAMQRVTEEERAVLSLLDLPEDGAVMGRRVTDAGTLFETLLGRSDTEVMRILAFVMAQSLASGTALIDRLGCELGVMMADCWTPDDAFLSLIRERETLLAMLADLGGKVVAQANQGSPAKLLRAIIRQYVTGEGREKRQGWVPPYLTFPASGYTDRGGVRQTA